MADSIDINFNLNEDEKNPLREGSAERELKDAAKAIETAAQRITDSGKPVYATLGADFNAPPPRSSLPSSPNAAPSLNSALNGPQPHPPQPSPQPAPHPQPQPSPGPPQPPQPPGPPQGPNPPPQPSPGPPQPPNPPQPSSGGQGMPWGAMGRGLWGGVSGIGRGLWNGVRGTAGTLGIGLAAGGGVAALARAAGGEAPPGLTGGSILGGLTGSAIGSIFGGRAAGGTIGATLGASLGSFGYDAPRQRYRQYSPGIQFAEAETTLRNTRLDMRRASEVDAPLSRLTRARGVLGTAVDEVQHQILKVILRFEPQIKKVVEFLTGVAASLAEYMPAIGTGLEYIQKVIVTILDLLNSLVKFITGGFVDIEKFLADLVKVGRKFEKELDKDNQGMPGVFDVGRILGVDAGATPNAMPVSGAGDNFNWNW